MKEDTTTANLYTFFDNMGAIHRASMGVVSSNSGDNASTFPGKHAAETHYYRWVSHRYAAKIYANGLLAFDRFDPVFEQDKLRGLICDVRESVERLELRARINREHFDLLFHNFNKKK